MTDRSCIHSNGELKFHYSTQDLVSCCKSCGNGCDGGDIYSPFVFWLEEGIVSGGLYNSSQGCMPYKMPACEHHVKGNRPSCSDLNPKDLTPACKSKCESTYGKSYKQDKHFAKKAYILRKNSEEMMYEIMTNGPLEGAFSVFEDFVHYKSGVYHHVAGSHIGDHAIRVLGWGEEIGIPYWLVANSWDSDWGDNGFFKILRGSNECGFEMEMTGGIPKI